MRNVIICLGLIAAVLAAGCAQHEPKDKVRVKAPFVDVRVKEDGSTSVTAPGTDVKVKGN